MSSCMRAGGALVLTMRSVELTPQMRQALQLLMQHIETLHPGCAKLAVHGMPYHRAVAMAHVMLADINWHAARVSAMLRQPRVELHNHVTQATAVYRAQLVAQQVRLVRRCCFCTVLSHPHTLCISHPQHINTSLA